MQLHREKLLINRLPNYYVSAEDRRRFCEQRKIDARQPKIDATRPKPVRAAQAERNPPRERVTGTAGSASRQAAPGRGGPAIQQTPISRRERKKGRSRTADNDQTDLLTAILYSGGLSPGTAKLAFNRLGLTPAAMRRQGYYQQLLSMPVSARSLAVSLGSLLSGPQNNPFTYT